MALNEDNVARVRRILVEHLNVDAEKVTPTASIYDDLGADSLDAVELIMACEEEFGIEIPDDQAEDVATVQGIYDLIEKRIGG